MLLTFISNIITYIPLVIQIALLSFNIYVEMSQATYQVL